MVKWYLLQEEDSDLDSVSVIDEVEELLKGSNINERSPDVVDRSFKGSFNINLFFNFYSFLIFLCCL